ncbi:MAG TPA: DNA modification methylase [Planctomycetota bacterium]|nr:DNA modification methylase [Planctomycetota bacterium]
MKPIEDPEIRGLIPPLSEAELRQLEASLVAEGCRDALVVWEEQNILLDGYHRKTICERLGIPYETKPMAFAERWEALEWVIRNQLGRRNLTLYARVLLALELEPVFAAQAKANQGTRTDLSTDPSKSPRAITPIDTRAEVAKAAGVSPATVDQVKLIEKWVEPEVKAMLLAGEVRIGGVYEAYQDIIREALLLQAEEAGEGSPIDDPGPGEPPDDPVTRTGDLWILGEHRLLCGDSGSTEDLDRLLAGAPIHLVNMDPPYGVRVEPRSNNAIAAGLSSFRQTHHQKFDLARHPSKAKPTGRMRPKDRPLINDHVSPEEYARLLRAWFGNAARVLLPGGSFYIWGGYSNCGDYPPALVECGLEFHQAIIWDKEWPVLTRGKDFLGAHEWCFYGWKEGAAHQFFGRRRVTERSATDLWHIKKMAPKPMGHLTPKPVELAMRAILYSSRTGENVLDLFGGGGFTLIAAEKTGRKAFLMEIDEPYCDVIVERWLGVPGKEAVLDGTGQTFAQVAAERGFERCNEPDRPAWVRTAV